MDRRPRIDAWVALPLIALLAIPAPGLGQNASKGAVADPLAGLEVGHWVRLEGTLNGTRGPIPCVRARQLTGDFLDDDWALRGAVTAVNPKHREFSIGGCRVRVTDRTVFNHPTRTFREFADLRPGLLVEVEGTFLSSGILLAAEVDDESDDLIRRPALREELEVVGRIARLDARRRLITVMGLEFQVTGATRMRSPLR